MGVAKLSNKNGRKPSGKIPENYWKIREKLLVDPQKTVEKYPVNYRKTIVNLLETASKVVSFSFLGVFQQFPKYFPVI